MTSDDPRGPGALAVSFVIAAVLCLQAYASFFSRDLADRVSILEKVRAPNTFPFLDYPMYWEARYPGDMMEHLVVIGILDDAIEVAIEDADVSLISWHLRYLINATVAGDFEKTKRLVELWESRHGKRLKGLRVEKLRVVFTGTGGEERPPEVLKVVTLPIAEDRGQ